ncbi:MAG TPA: hypothetical protein VH475_21590, partial [Tepidisphaeraceae bacterium]
MRSLLLRFKKHPAGHAAALACTRPDGSVTWQRQRPRHAAFFTRHDLTHYAVETVLAYRRGFFGLIADGWNFDDFGHPWPRGPIPADADPAELIVGFFDAERTSPTPWSAEDFNRYAAGCFASLGVPGAAPPP